MTRSRRYAPRADSVTDSRFDTRNSVSSFGLCYLCVTPWTATHKLVYFVTRTATDPFEENTMTDLDQIARERIAAYLRANPNCDDNVRVVCHIFNAHTTMVFTAPDLALVAEGLYRIRFTEERIVEALDVLRAARLLRYNGSARNDAHARHYEFRF
jgi:hypothetical protein